MAKPVRIGIIGAGKVSQAHIRGYQDTGAGDVLAVADVVETAAQQRADQFGITDAYGDPAELLARKDIQAVSLCVPNAFHAPVASAALKAGKHVLLEKPMATTVAEARRMRNAAQKYRRVLMLGVCFRYAPPVQAVKKMIDAGKLGDVYYGYTTILRRRGIPGYGRWFTRQELSGGGALIDNGVHAIDLAMYLMGFPKPVAVTAMTQQRIGGRPEYRQHDVNAALAKQGKFDVEDLAHGFIRFANDAALYFELAWAVNLPDTIDLKVSGTRGGLHFDFKKVTVYTQQGARKIDKELDVPPGLRFNEEVKHFCECIRRRRQPISNADQGVVVQQILEAVYKSADQGREVRIR